MIAEELYIQFFVFVGSISSDPTVNKAFGGMRYQGGVYMFIKSPPLQVITGSALWNILRELTTD